MKNSGFTLVEILVAIVILGIVALGIMALLPNGYAQITKAGRITTMNELGQQTMDRLRTLPYTHSDLTNGGHNDSSPQLTTFYRAGTSYPEIYSIYWVVSDNSPISNTKSVVVTVGFNMYNSSGTLIPSSQASNQMSYDFRTVITP